MAVAQSRPHYRLERKAMKEGFLLVAGTDEAGCAPLAGPVVAAAVVLDPKRIPKGINDSKKLTPEAREVLFAAITARARWAVGIADVARIDTDNILNARLWAMARAVEELGVAPDLVLVDGNRAPGLACPARTVIAGDAVSVSIAAASIIAKVTRDRLMCELDAQWPGYGFARHKGYGTPDHCTALARLGPSPHHRRSFAPVRLLIGAAEAALAAAIPTGP
jgi:ribonuclease HII